MPLDVISYKFIASAALTAAKTAVYQMSPGRSSSEPMADRVDRQSVSGAYSIGVHPSGAQGRFFQTDLSLGKVERKMEMVLTDAVCSVSKSKTIIKTALVGLSGTVKEYIRDGDYEVSISVGLVAMKDGHVVDEYPAEGVRDLRDLLDGNEALYVSSDFLQLFDITRLVVVDYAIQQMTYGNYQVVTIRAISDEDYTIKCNEY